MNITERLDYCSAADFLATPADREAYFRGMSEADFVCSLVLLNSTLLPLGEGRGLTPPPVRMVTMLSNEALEPSAPGQEVLYTSSGHQDTLVYLNEALRAGQGMENADDAVTMLGLVTASVHRLYNGHTRTLAVGRQLLSPSGRGYGGTRADRAYYTRLATKRAVYMKHGLSPVSSTVARTFSTHQTNAIAKATNYAGPTIASNGAPGTFPEIIQKLPARDPSNKMMIAYVIGERNFGSASIAAYLQHNKQDIGAYLVDSPAGPVLSPDRYIHSIRDADEYLVRDTLLTLHDRQKDAFFRSLIDCIAHGDDGIYGPASSVLNQYPLPKS
ncbi:MAG TPA: hypothetical protein VLE73_01155 [Candidatus Saccharimonadales bacterium]|nr:hypothetical protein [Candidatus Saccharimonadales bacterium]